MNTQATAQSVAPKSKAAWKALGFRVPTKCRPDKIESYFVPGYSTVMRERYLYSSEQVLPIDPEQAMRRAAASQKAIATRKKNMEDKVSNVELTIVAGLSDDEIRHLAICTHGGNYAGRAGEFHWHNGTARNCIRHNLTNYEFLWALINRGPTAYGAYCILRDRADALVVKTYSQFAPCKAGPADLDA
jgi:hypothetical protein